MKTYTDYQEEFRKLQVYKDIVFIYPTKVLSILSNLKRISGFDYKTSNYTNGEIMSFPVYLDENRDELERLFNISKYLERLHNMYDVAKEYENQCVVDLVQLVDDFRYLHPIDIRMVRYVEDYPLYDPESDENFYYYYKLQDSFFQKVIQVCKSEECSGEFVEVDVKGKTKYFCCQKGFEKYHYQNLQKV